MPWGRKGSGNRNQLIVRKHSQASFKNILSVTKGKEVSRTTTASSGKGQGLVEETSLPGEAKVQVTARGSQGPCMQVGGAPRREDPGAGGAGPRPAFSASPAPPTPRPHPRAQPARLVSGSGSQNTVFERTELTLAFASDSLFALVKLPCLTLSFSLNKVELIMNKTYFTRILPE